MNWSRLRRTVLEGCVIVLVALMLWWGYGGRWVHVVSPSMGTAAPVGSLLWVAPATPDDIDPGDIVTFHAPRPGKPVYTHRVVAQAGDGALRTRGDLSGDDPWTVPADDVVGEVRAVWPGVGWLMTAIPILLPGLLVAVGIASLVRRQRQAPVAMVLAAAVVACAVAVYGPLVGAAMLPSPTAAGPTDGPERTEARFVGTGLLATRVTAVAADGSDAGSIVLGPGHDGLLALPEGSGVSGRVPVRIEAAVAPWTWGLLLVPCLLPGLVVALRRRRRDRPLGRHVATAAGPRTVPVVPDAAPHVGGLAAAR